MPRAVRATFLRILIFYILTILTIGLCINNQDPTLLTAANGTSLSHFLSLFTSARLALLLANSDVC